MPFWCCHGSSLTVAVAGNLGCGYKARSRFGDSDEGLCTLRTCRYQAPFASVDRPVTVLKHLRSLAGFQYVHCPRGDEDDQREEVGQRAEESFAGDPDPASNCDVLLPPPSQMHQAADYSPEPPQRLLCHASAESAFSVSCNDAAP